jgi:hypothetical protein
MVRFFERNSTGTKHMASARKRSNSKGSRPKRARAFAVCVRNDGYEASLELRKLYRALRDRAGEEHGFIRVIDESGEDYLYPADYFVRLDLPIGVTQKLRKIA